MNPLPTTATITVQSASPTSPACPEARRMNGNTSVAAESRSALITTGDVRAVSDVSITLVADHVAAAISAASSPTTGSGGRSLFDVARSYAGGGAFVGRFASTHASVAARTAIAAPIAIPRRIDTASLVDAFVSSLASRPASGAAGPAA